MNSLLVEWLEELKETPLQFYPGSGAMENLWLFSFPDEISEDEIVRFVLEARTIRAEQNAAMNAGQTVFYVWHDEQAGQLRFSVARCTLDNLPFGARVELVSDLGAIVRSYVASPYRWGIPWEEFSEVSPEEEEPPPAKEYVLPVWASELT